MTFLFPLAGSPDVITVHLTTTNATDIAGADTYRMMVYWIQVNEYTGATPNLTLDLYDGTTAYPIGIGGVTWVAKAMTAYQSLLFNEGLMIPKTWRLRATAGTASKIKVVGQLGLVLNQ